MKLHLANLRHLANPYSGSQRTPGVWIQHSSAAEHLCNVTEWQDLWKKRDQRQKWWKKVLRNAVEAAGNGLVGTSVHWSQTLSFHTFHSGHLMSWLREVRVWITLVPEFPKFPIFRRFLKVVFLIFRAELSVKIYIMYSFSQSSLLTK
jgi:hypothetical protein